jgi:predicted phage terminase large subunit-like protein
MTSYRAAGQFQQRPSPEEGGIIKRAWWRYYPAEWLKGEEWPEAAPPMKRIWQSWDTAFTEKTSSDFTVGTLWGADLANRYLIRRMRGRWSLTETKEQVQQLTDWADKRFPWHAGHQKRVENTANGPRVLAALRDEIQGLVPINVEGRDKTQRVYAVTPQLEAGNVHLPGQPSADLSGPDASCPAWVLDFVDECAAFPNGAFDDQVDSMTQALDPTIRVGKRRRVRSGGRDKRAAMRMR